MNKDVDILIKELEKSLHSDEFISSCYHTIEEISNLDNSFDAVEPILKLMEENKSIDFGSPGPLAHFIEKFYKKGYEEKLVQSIKKCPTEHTLWLLNRIINGAEEQQKAYYIELLESVIDNKELDSNIILTAKEFREYHD